VIRQVELFRILLTHRVRFIVVGGAAAVLQGVPINTLDVERHGVVLERLIEVKRKLTRPKDRLMLLHLEAAFDERKKNERR